MKSLVLLSVDQKCLLVPWTVHEMLIPPLKQASKLMILYLAKVPLQPSYSMPVHKHFPSISYLTWSNMLSNKDLPDTVSTNIAVPFTHFCRSMPYKKYLHKISLRSLIFVDNAKHKNFPKENFAP